MKVRSVSVQSLDAYSTVGFDLSLSRKDFKL